MDFYHYSPQQIRAHCRSNARSLALNTASYQSQRQASLTRSERVRAQFNEEIRSFRAWRAAFLVPLRDTEESPQAAYETRLPHACQSLFKLRVTWSALSPLLTADEREVSLKPRLRPDGDLL
jgi:hypothetical protein